MTEKIVTLPLAITITFTDDETVSVEDLATVTIRCQACPTTFHYIAGEFISAGMALDKALSHALDHRTPQ